MATVEIGYEKQEAPIQHVLLRGACPKNVFGFKLIGCGDIHTVLPEQAAYAADKFLHGVFIVGKQELIDFANALLKLAARAR